MKGTVMTVLPPLAANKTTYGYNIRSWVTSITGPRFSESLAFSFGGNVTSQTWITGDGISRRYSYTYDALSRLTWADYSENGSTSDKYRCYCSYDKMGNMTYLVRYGKASSGNYGMIDQVNLTYDGNQLRKADNLMSGPAYYGAFHFKDAATADVEYTYDQNGRSALPLCMKSKNMTKDLNKNISQIQYNLLNLPSKVTLGNGSTANYTYDAGGAKLHAAYVPSVGTAHTVDYCGNMIYEDNALKQILIDGGYVTLSGSTPQYHFYLSDHLGSVRIVANSSGTAEQVNHYYPFGVLIGDDMVFGQTVQRHRYNGKELDRMYGLDWYDYDARQYDGAVFTTMDPLCEKYYNISPYAYCANNPVNAVDPDGRDFIITVNEEHKTFTVHAMYYTKKKDAAMLQEGIDLWNGLSGKFKMDGYTVNFDLEMKVVEEAENMPFSSDYIVKSDISGMANSFEVGGKMEDNTNALTQEGKMIGSRSKEVLDARGAKGTVAHEIGHTLGIMHSGTGLMSASSSERKSLSVGEKQIKSIFKRATKRRSAKRASGSINFDSGIVPPSFKLEYKFDQ